MQIKLLKCPRDTFLLDAANWGNSQSKQNCGCAPEWSLNQLTTNFFVGWSERERKRCAFGVFVFGQSPGSCSLRSRETDYIDPGCSWGRCATAARVRGRNWNLSQRKHAHGQLWRLSLGLRRVSFRVTLARPANNERKCETPQITGGFARADLCVREKTTFSRQSDGAGVFLFSFRLAAESESFCRQPLRRVLFALLRRRICARLVLNFSSLLRVNIGVFAFAEWNGLAGCARKKMGVFLSLFGKPAGITLSARPWFSFIAQLCQ